MDRTNYDELRNKNIAERNAIFAEIFKDLQKQKGELKVYRQKKADNYDNEPPRKRRRTISEEERPFQGRNVRLQFRKKYNTRSRASLSGSDQPYDFENKENEDEESTGNKPKFQVLFPWAKPSQRSIDLMKMGVCDVDEEEEKDGTDADDDDYVPRKRIHTVTRSKYDPDSIPSVDEITEEMLENVAQKSSWKQYSKSNGTSCHQCRQKTLDTKTVCRSGECIGVRGQFCGPCLKVRYGEIAVEALKDPNWVCPPCRGLCNCSICRTRDGLRPTGILAPMVQEEGFSSVMEYLRTTDENET